MVEQFIADYCKRCNAFMPLVTRWDTCPRCGQLECIEAELKDQVYSAWLRRWTFCFYGPAQWWLATWQALRLRIDRTPMQPQKGTGTINGRPLAVTALGARDKP